MASGRIVTQLSAWRGVLAIVKTSHCANPSTIARRKNNLIYGPAGCAQRSRPGHAAADGALRPEQPAMEVDLDHPAVVGAV